MKQSFKLLIEAVSQQSCDMHGEEKVMKRVNKLVSVLGAVVLVMLVVVTVCGICSFHTGYSYQIVNQYGESIRIWGAGIYAHDSYFKAPIFIGSDFTILLVAVPLMIVAFRKLKTKLSLENYIQLFSITSLVLYYSASLAFGVTYNRLHLAYVVLFGGCFFLTAALFVRLYGISCRRQGICTFSIPKGTKTFLIVAGISLFVAWLPDIISSLVKGTSLELIEVYTTEITYVLDMGLISPLMFLTLYLICKKDFVGYILLRMLLKICAVIGLLLPLQTVAQLLAGISIPLPALITKVAIFVLLALFAVLFEYKLKRGTKWESE